jgi:Ca-activated chloride channel family protein
MPLRGSNTESAVERGIQLLTDAGAHQGDLLLVTDGVVPEAFNKIRDLLSHTSIHMSILGVGTNQPAPVPAGNGGGFLHDKQGAIITTQLNSSELNNLAQQVHGRYHDIANNDNDIDYLMPSEEKNEKSKPTLERDFDQWFDQGHWLVFLLLPIVLFCFRRGFILLLMCIPLWGALSPAPAYAFSWEDMWLTKDQQAARSLNKGDTKSAAEEFESPDWKAAAQYRAGDYAAAAENFAKSDTASAHYNRGNALAKSGKLEDAIKAYDEALKRDANLDDAKKNRETVEKLLKQQKEQNKQDSDKNQDQKDQDKKDQDKKDKDQNKDCQNKQDKDKNEQSQQDKDQKNKDQKDSQNKDDSNKQNQQNTSSGNNASANSQQQSGQSSAGDNSQSGQTSSAANSAQANAANAQQSSAAGSAQNQQMAQSSEQSTNDKDKEQKQAAIDQSNLTPEQKQALEQWLRRVPDDPGGLLRNKFKWQYIQNRQKQAEGDFESPENHADQRY